MKDNVIYLDYDLPPQEVLEAAMEEDMNEVIVIGYDAEDRFYFHSNKGDVESVIFLLEYAKYKFLKTIDEGMNE